MRRPRILLMSLALFVLTLLISCGQDLCVAGIGSCNGLKKNLQKQGGKDLQQGGFPPTDKLAIGCKSWGQCWTTSEMNLELMASGGTPPYTFKVVDNYAGNIVPGTSLFYLTTTSRVKTRVRVIDAYTPATAPCDLCEVEVSVIPKP